MSYAIVISELMSGWIGCYNDVAHMIEPVLPVKYPRTSGYRLEEKDNPYNAWLV